MEAEAGATPVVTGIFSSEANGSSDELNAAVALQKAYRGYRTRRKLADSVVVAEELWWQALSYAKLNHGTTSFFSFMENESASSKWSRIGSNASKVGKGLSKDAKAQKMRFEHWIEAIDPRHRYGRNLQVYYEEWCKTDAGQPFFYWLDVGDGKELDLEGCPRAKLRKQCIKYLGPQEREHYEYVVIDGKIINKMTGDPLDTLKGGAKWIFVMSASKKFYAAEKMKGVFQHSSFLAGGAISAGGRIVAENGILKRISAYSGHYVPTEDSLREFLSFMKTNGLNLDEVEIFAPNEDIDSYSNGSSLSREGSTLTDSSTNQEPPVPEIPQEEVEPKKTYKRTLSGGLQSPKAEVPKSAMLQRINSKKAAKSYQLGDQLALKWLTGVGPRIGCVADYPVEVRKQALEFVNLSQGTPCIPSA